MAAEQNAEGLGPLGPLEAEVMATLWHASEPLSVRQAAEALNAHRRSPLAYTTVMTVLSRLADKGVVARTLVGRAYAYAPVAADSADIAVRGVLAAHGDAALARFVDRIEFDSALRERLRALMQEQEREQP